MCLQGTDGSRMRAQLLQAGDDLHMPGPCGSFWLVLAGQAQLLSAQGTFRASAGEWIALTAEAGQGVAIQSDGKVVGLIVPAELQARWFCDPLVPVYFMARGGLLEQDHQRCLQLLLAGMADAELLGEHEPDASARHALEWQRLLSGLQVACRELSETCPGYSVLRRRQVFMRFQQALMILQGNPERIVRIAELARRCNFSFCYFSRVFQSLYGQTPQRIAARHRLERAHALVTATEIPIIDVAAECGFENPSSFARAFRAQYGAAASTLRVSVSQRGVVASQSSRARGTGACNGIAPASDARGVR